MSKSVIPINTVIVRNEHLTHGIPFRNHVYPYRLLDESSNNYNFEHIKDCLREWDSYSDNINDNIIRVSNLLELVSPEDLPIANDIVCNQIIPYVKNPTIYSPLFSENEEVCNKIVEQAECDRLLSNYNTVNKRFNIDKHFIFGLKESNCVDTVFRFCDMIDTYNIDYKSKFCITTECAMYSLTKNFLNQSTPMKSVIESIINYHLIQYGNRDMNKFIDNMRDSISKDRFITEDASNYIDFLEKVNNNMDDSEDNKEIQKYINENVQMNMIDTFDEYKHMSKALKRFYESAVFDKISELIARATINYRESTNPTEAIKNIMNSIKSNK